MAKHIQSTAISAPSKEILTQLANPSNLEALLLQLTAPDTQIIQQAEAVIKKYVKSPVCVAGLVQQLQGSTYLQVRQLSAMLLRRRLGPHWNKLDAHTKEALKAALLHTLANEQERPIRKNIASVIAVAARKLLSKNKWNELLSFIYQYSQSKEEEHRELAFVVLNELAETLGRCFGSQFGNLQQLYQAGLRDPSRRVQVAALKASAALIMHLVTEDVSSVFQDLVQGMLEVARGCLEAGEEEVVSQVLDVFSELASSSASVITHSVPQIIRFCLEVLNRGDTLQNSTQDVAGMVLIAIAEEKPRSLGKKGLVPDIVATLLHMMAVSQDNAAGELLSAFDGRDAQDEDDEDYEGPSGQDIAQRCLDAMAIHVPAKYFYQPTMALIGQGLDSQDFNARKAGTAALAVIIEGCSEEVTQHLSSILPRVLAAARDLATCVRECACFVLGQLSENCQPEILECHGEILPCIFALLEDATPSVQLTGCHVLETFCEHLDKAVVGHYLRALLERLHQLLQSPKTSVQEAAIGAIAATAVGAEDGFIPYLHEIAPLIAQALPVTDERLLRMKGRAMDCMGRMATAVGQAHFAPYLDVSMQVAVQCFELDSLSLKEDAYLLLAQLVGVLKEGFAPHLEGLVPQLCAVLQEKEGEVVWVDEEEEDTSGVSRIVSGLDEEDEEGEVGLGARDPNSALGTKTSESNETEDGDDEEDYGATPIYDVHTGMLDVKKAAAYCLGELSQHTGVHFAPFIEMSLVPLQTLTQSFNHMLREEVAAVMPYLVLSATAASPPSRPWGKADFSDTLSAPTRSVCKAALEVLLGLTQDEDQDVATRSLISLQAVLEHIGPCLLFQDEDRQRFMTVLLDIFRENLPCQQVTETVEDEGVDDEEKETSRDLIEAGADLVGAVSRTFGSAFVPYLDLIMQPLSTFTNATRPEGHRQAASGCLGEITEGLGADSKRYFEALLPILKLCLADDCNGVKRNAAWCLGISCEVLGSDIQPYVMEVLQSLHPLFRLPPTEDGSAETVDNATAAVARLIMAAPAAVPMTVVVPALLQALPLKADQCENPTVYKCLHQLVHSSVPELKPHVGNALSVYGQILSEPRSVQDEVLANDVLPGLRLLFQNPTYNEQASLGLQSFAPEARAVIARHLQQ
ncbi:Importin-beta [Nannochloropsis gaditana]|uniref:Importin-beta n=1 Tax=Nannochloropsis gaditana TaxID=72520 RepID=W7TR49_9STRA|nr:Importin-beta [Nannochloropsis gaditana]